MSFAPDPISEFATSLRAAVVSTVWIVGFIIIAIVLTTVVGGCATTPELERVEYSAQCDGAHLVDEATGQSRCEVRVGLFFNIGYLIAQFGSFAEYEVEGSDETVWCPTVLVEAQGEMELLGEQGAKLEGLPPDLLDLLDPRCEDVMPPLAFTPLAGVDTGE